MALHLFIQRDIRATKAIDGLLRNRRDKELAGDWTGAPPVLFIRIVRGQQHQQFQLEAGRYPEIHPRRYE